MNEEINNNNKALISFKLLDQLIDQNPDLTESEILKIYHQRLEKQNKIIELISDSIGDKTSHLIKSLTDTQKPVDPQSSAQYQIDGIISSGGQSDVYLAHRSDGTYEKTVAIKVLKNRYTDPVERDAFLKETQILAELQHPNIVNIIDAGINQNDEPWMILNHIKGTHIDQFIQDNQLSPPKAIGLLIDICKALDYIHQQQIYHLDIKPANIMVKTFEDNAQALLIDFGISIQQQTIKDHLNIKKPKLATFAFASPEQLNNNQSPIDHRSDIYSLGKLIKYLVSEYLTDCKNNTDLLSIIKKATEHEPQNRYPDIKKLQHDLTQFKHNKSVSTRPLNVIQKLSRGFKNKPFISTSITVLLLIISALFITNWLQKTQQQQQAKLMLERSQYYWDQTDEIINTSRILYLKPKQNIHKELVQLNLSFDVLFNKYLTEKFKQKQTIALSIAEAGISLGRFSEAQKALLFAIQDAPGDNKIITHLAQNHLNIYQQELQKNKQYSSQKIREAQAGILYKRHVIAAENLINSLPSQIASQNVITESMVKYFNGDIHSAIDQLKVQDRDELWPIPRLLQAAQFMAEEGRKLKAESKHKVALAWYQQAYDTISQANDIARSHPEIIEKKCLIQAEIITININFNKDIPNVITACEDLLTVSGNAPKSLLVVSKAYVNLALVILKTGKKPVNELNRAISSINKLKHNLEDTSLANLLLGQINQINADWKLNSQQDGIKELKQSITHFKVAADLMPNDYLIQTEYANALYKYANAIRPFNSTADRTYQQATNQLKQLLSHADATVLLSSNIVKIMTDHAYYRYQNSLNAEQQLDEASAILSGIKTEWTDHNSMSGAESYLHWTYADYLVFQGKDPEPHLSQAINAFELSINVQPKNWVLRYNKISAMLSGVTYYLTHGKDQTIQLKSIENQLKQLNQIVAKDVDLSAHQGYYHNMMAKNQIINQINPESQFQQSRKFNMQCLLSPYDRYTCLSQFATLALMQYEQDTKYNGFNTQQWQADLTIIDVGLNQFPDHHQLMAQRAQLRLLAIKNQQLSIEVIKQQLTIAQQELNTVLKAQPLLSGRYQNTLNQINELIQEKTSTLNSITEPQSKPL